MTLRAHHGARPGPGVAVGPATGPSGAPVTVAGDGGRSSSGSRERSPCAAGGASSLPAGLLSPWGRGVARRRPARAGLGALAAAGVAGDRPRLRRPPAGAAPGGPAMVLVVPASYGLLPGLAIFRGLYEMVERSSADAGSRCRSRAASPRCSGRWRSLLAIATGRRPRGVPGRALGPRAWCRSDGPVAVDRYARCTCRNGPKLSVTPWFVMFRSTGCDGGTPGASTCNQRIRADNCHITAYPSLAHPPRRTSSGGCLRRNTPGRTRVGDPT